MAAGKTALKFSAIVAVGSTLYGLAGGSVYMYDEANFWWTPISMQRAPEGGEGPGEK